MSPQTGSQPTRAIRTGKEHKALELLREELKNTYSRGVHQLMQSRANDDRDMGDQARLALERDLEGLMGDITHAQANQIKAYIVRLERGEITRGICVDCEGQIPEKRMKAVPWATRCTGCQEEKELKTA